MAEAVGGLISRHDRIPPQRDGDTPPIPRLPQFEQPRTRTFHLASAARHALDQRRLFILLPFAVVAGLIASLATSILPDIWLLAAVAAALVVAIPFNRQGLVRLRVLALCLAAWAGFGLLPLHGAISGTKMLERPLFGTYEARVDEVLSETAGEMRVVVSEIKALGTARAPDIRRARLLIRGGPALTLGDRIRGPIRFTPVPGPAVPGGFDGQFHAYFEGIGAYGNSTKPPERIEVGSASAPDAFVATLRHQIGVRIDQALPQPAAGVARALINGDQSRITDEVREVMATAGIAHVYSVSGLHLTIVAGGVFVLIRFLAALAGPMLGAAPIKPVAAACGIVFAVGYFAISGGNVAALRSTVMIILVLVAVIFGRRALTMRNVAIAALFILAVDPASVFRPSFQLSFSAVVALVGAYELVSRAPGHQRGIARQVAGYFVGISLTSLVAGAATLVFSVYHFQQTSPLGVVGNLVTLPLVGFIMMPAAAASTLAMPFGLEYLPLQVLGWSIDRMLDTASGVAAMSAGLTASPLLTPMALIIALVALAWFAFFPGKVRLIMPALALPVIVLTAMDRAPDVLISDTTQAVAIRSGDGYVLAAGKPGSFGVRVWEETFGMPIIAAADATLRCDALGCIAAGDAGFTLAVVRNAQAFDEDCFRADVIIARGVSPPGACEAPVVDRQDLARGGVIALYWDGARRRFEQRTAIPGAVRPWRLPTP